LISIESSEQVMPKGVVSTLTVRGLNRIANHARLTVSALAPRLSQPTRNLLTETHRCMRGQAPIRHSIDLTGPR
jgi:hypothetical protein